VYKQNPPNAIQIEPTEGCNLACTFCGINGIREKPGVLYNFMTLGTAKNIALQVQALMGLDGWNPRIEFALHGEPTMNPNLREIIQVFREHLPATQLMVTSNGGGLLKGNTVQHINDLFYAGLNILALDDYQSVKIVPKIRQRVEDDMLGGLASGIEWYEYPEQPEGNPHKRYGVHHKMVTCIADISVTHTGTHAHLANHAGAAAPPSDAMAGKRCAKPFRELSIRWNGDVALCCDDWRGVYKIGNVLATQIGDLWHSAAFDAARKKLYHGERDFGACKGCTQKSFRVGLLPDPLGKVELPHANQVDQQLIAKATQGKPFANVIVWRPWEQKQ
jgi:MoaA/NifB/PqqE/SkfB family radical SAM enzyme